ncbi:unnamed protein product [Ilex paraguariensis]|uniref:Exostosin GT47 domain-containing protein n=1 Tax=Ilex paraguariensis TaxID=185542 RepID=A0ABC8SJA6_9AQUA
MGIGAQFQRLSHVNIQRLMLIMGMIITVVVLSQLFALPYGHYLSVHPNSHEGTGFLAVSSTVLLNGSKSANSIFLHGVVNKTDASKLDEEDGYESEVEGEGKTYGSASKDDGKMDKFFEKEKNSRNESTSKEGLTLKKSSTMRNVRSTNKSSNQEKVMDFGLTSIQWVKKSDYNLTRGNNPKNNTYSTPAKYPNRAGSGSLPLKAPTISKYDNSHEEATNSSVSALANTSVIRNSKQVRETQPKISNTGLLQSVSDTSNNTSSMAGNSVMKEGRIRPTSISDMNSILLQTYVSTSSVRPQWSSARDRELQNAKLQIENSRILKNTPGLHASLFRNFSMFRRGYGLMEKMLKVYIYREGEKPIFHQPYMRGIYASEGWFMKLIEGNKQFVVRDPKKAHLFYLPISSLKLRSVLHEQNFSTQNDLQKYLENYVDMIAKKYRFWNRTKGADHFLVACHDWAPHFTRNKMGSCIRALCNSNVVRGFKIGKDVSLPVTYVRTSQNPQMDLGGNPPSERPILAFFAGGMHGYLRPILLQYWNNKEPDMKIFGPMPRDIEGKLRYREFMKSSKYCICAKGYEVHTPRVVESIYYECVPVIISDNYVPPFFEILDWEAFSVFVSEKDIPNLRNILLSIPEKKYLAMQQRVKMVQQHFLWHKKPVKYDLFHMILHSIWHNRVFQL